MKTGNALTKFVLCLIVLVGIDYFPAYAQKQKTKVTIIKETYDEQGNKTVQTIVKEGAEADAIDLDHLSEGGDRNHLQWQRFDMDSLPMDGQFFNYSFKHPQDLRSLFDSLGMGNFNFFDQEDFPLFDGFGFDQGLDDSKPKLGVKISEIDSQSGVVITNVIPDTPADRAGLKQGDIIVSADGIKIESPEDLINHIQSLQADDEVLLDILREGDYMEISAKLTQHKPKKELEIRKI